MTAHYPLERLANKLIAEGVPTTIRVGAQGKSARMFAAVGYYRGCQAVVPHHTGSSGNHPVADIAYIDGKGGSDPGFVISNAYVARDGHVTLIASGPTYTEGRGGPHGIIPENRGNDVSFSIEIGGGGREFPTAQQRSTLLLSRHAAIIAAEVWGWPDDPFSRDRLFGHFEWTSRKWDPGGLSQWGARNDRPWDMDAFRRDARVSTTDPGEADMKKLPSRRLVDTRGPDDNYDAYKPEADSQHTLRIPEAAGCGAAQITVTVTDPEANGFLRAWAGGPAPDTSFSNPAPGLLPADPHTLFVDLATDGSFQLYTLSSVHFIVDFTGIALLA